MSLKKNIQSLLEKYEGQKLPLFELKAKLFDLNPYEVSTPAHESYHSLISDAIMDHAMGDARIFSTESTSNLASMVHEPEAFEAKNLADKSKDVGTGIMANNDVTEAEKGEKDNKSELVKSEFAVDDSNYYPGYHDPEHHWNGWAVPMFDKETAIKICKDLEKPHEEKDGELWVNLDPESEDSELEKVGPFKEKVDGKEMDLYDIGGSIWVWAEKGDDE